MHNWPQLGLIQVKRRMSAYGSIGAPQEDWSVSDFCLNPHAMAGIARQAGLMDRMVLRAGIGLSSTARSADPVLWYEARLKCIGCAMSQRCMRFLASPKPTGLAHVPSFCANRTFFGDLSQWVSNLELGGANDGPASIGFPHAPAPDLASGSEQTSSDQ